MASEPEYASGAPAPETGTYELLQISGSSVGVHTHVEAGSALPPAPRAWTWRLVRER
jgi:hypothetical protein